MKILRDADVLSQSPVPPKGKVDFARVTLGWLRFFLASVILGPLGACGEPSFAVAQPDADLPTVPFDKGEDDPHGEGGQADTRAPKPPQDASGAQDGGLGHPDREDASEGNVDAGRGLPEASPKPDSETGPAPTCGTYSGPCARVDGLACGYCPPPGEGVGETACGDNDTFACGNVCLATQSPHHADGNVYTQACLASGLPTGWVAPGDCVGVPWEYTGGSSAFRPAGRQGCQVAPYDAGAGIPSGVVCCL